MNGFGYAYPAYECFKAVEKNEPDTEQLLFWCQYWVLVAVFTVGERGTDYVYNVSLRPYVAKHEKEIDLNLLKLRIKARDISLLFWEKAAI
ncbi:hypothetical protein WN944_029315 [Citrus x changshan-huyou]|uniref:HVA22-like protein n=1 Tax=Citrus x changshan-huyou TaxID=2935761 RepID=A0AAP0LPE2_9ROSI